MQKVVDERELDIRNEVLNNRLRGFKRRRVDPATVGSQLFDIKNSVEDLMKIGYIDEIATVEEIMQRDFDSRRRKFMYINSKIGLAARSQLSL